jgi:hypothetical protein
VSWRQPRAFALRLHVSAAPPRVGLTQALDHMKKFSFLLIFISLVLCDRACSQNALEPCEREFLSNYYSGVDKIIDDAIGQPARLSITTLPSFHAESGVRIVGMNVYYVRFSSSFWSESSFFDEKSGRGGHDFFKPKMRTMVRYAPLKPELAARVAETYAAAIAVTKKSGRLGLDGVSYYFSMPDAGCGQAWSPDSDTFNYRLVELSELLAKHATLPNPQALQRSEKKISRLLNGLGRH